MQGFRSFHFAHRTIQGIKTVNMIRKGQIVWLANNIAGQVALTSSLFSLPLAAWVNNAKASHGVFDLTLATLPHAIH